MNNMFNGLFMKVQKGMCMLSPFGIAVKTSGGYRSYNVKTGKLRNCDNMVFSFGDGMFFVIPASRVKPGDIILSGGKPACVRQAGKDSIEVINYENATVETLLPERHVFMGNTWFYGKIVSLFGDGSSICGKENITKMMKFMMMSSLFDRGGGTADACGNAGAAAFNGGNTGMAGYGSGTTGIAAYGGGYAGMTPAYGMDVNLLMPLLLMKSGGFDDLFGNLFEEDRTDGDDAGMESDEDNDALF